MESQLDVFGSPFFWIYLYPINVNNCSMHRYKYICCQNVTDAIYVKCLLNIKQHRSIVHVNTKWVLFRIEIQGKFLWFLLGKGYMQIKK